MKIDFISDITKEYQTALNYPAIDRLMIKVLWWHLGFFALLTVLNSVFKMPARYPNPFGWQVISIEAAVASLVLALFAAVAPTLITPKLRNHYIKRLTFTLALVIFSYLFVFISGGSIEMHFHFFIIIAVVVLYADWRLGWVLLALTGLHHAVLNYVEPGWLYFYGRNDFSVISHALPVLAEVIFTTILCENIRKGVVELESAKSGLEREVTARTQELTTANASLEKRVQERTKELETLKTNLENEVKQRTQDLQGKMKELERLNEMMVGRELKMAELKAELKGSGEKQNPAPDKSVV